MKESALPRLPALGRPGPAFLPRLRNMAPTWVLGFDEPRARDGLAAGLLRAAPENPDLARLAAGLAFTSYAFRPLDHGCLTRLLAAQDFLPLLDAGSLKKLAALAPALADPPDAGPLTRLMAEGRTAELIKLLIPALGNPARGLALLGRTFEDLLKLPGGELARQALEAYPFPDELAFLKKRLLAEWGFFHLPPEEALELARQMDEPAWAPARILYQGRLGAALGNGDAWREALRALHDFFPLDVNTALCLHQAAFPRPPRPKLLDEKRVAVCLYSWNKADLLLRTLESLARTELGAAKILCLNNGSDDTTPQVLERAAGMFGDSFVPLTTLVNIGAPGARNWLLAAPEAAGTDYVAFVDDDVELPENWLAHLLGAAADHPGAGAVGCRITGASPPYVMQSADYHVLAPPHDKEDERILIFDNCAGRLDQGLFSYSRPCLSVSGCCHLISRQALDALGAPVHFDIRFNPTQFDDLDRDMRSSLAGLPSFYAGGLAVRHIQHSSLARAKSQAQVGNVVGNKMKLEAKYSGDDLARLFKTGLDLLWDDLAAKLARISG